jgi:ATP-grasp domain
MLPLGSCKVSESRPPLLFLLTFHERPSVSLLLNSESVRKLNAKRLERSGLSRLGYNAALFCLILWFCLLSSAAKKRGNDVVIKADILRSRRDRDLVSFKSGLKGGVHIVSTSEQARDIAAGMLGQEFLEPGTSEGRVCRLVLLQEHIHRRRRELYLSFFMDRASQGYVESSSLTLTHVRHLFLSFPSLLARS